MKKFYFLILFALIASAATFADATEKTVTFDSSTDKGTSSTSLTKDDITISAKTGSGKTAPNLNTYDEYRIYAKNTLTISANNDYDITQIVFTCTEGKPATGLSTKTGTYTTSSKTSGTWTGSANSIAFSASDQVRATKIEVTYTIPETQCAKPTFNYDAGTAFTDDTDLVISTTTSDAKISYTITKQADGSVFASGEDAAPVTIKLNENGTFHVKATAKKDGLDDSELAIANYTVNKTCPDPTFNHENSHVFKDPASITISSTLEGALLNYKITGPSGFETIEKTGVSAPATISDLSINGLYSVTASSTKVGYKDSNEKTLNFEVAKTCETPVADKEGVFEEPVTITLTSLTEGALIDYKVTTVDTEKTVEEKTNCASGVQVTISDRGSYKLVATCHKDDYVTSSELELLIELAIKSKAPTFSVEEGTYNSEQTIELATETEGAKIYYKINDATDYTVYSDPIVLNTEGAYTIAAYTDATENTSKSDVVTKTYILNLPISDPYELCKNDKFLTAGTKIIFVGLETSTYYGMSVTDGSFITGGTVTIASDQMTAKESAVKVFTIEDGTAGKVFSSFDNGKKVYVASTAASSQLSYTTSIAKNCNWTISIDSSTGKATVTNAQYTSGAGSTLLYNTQPNSPRFGAYTSSLKTANLYIYFLPSTSSVSKVAANEGVKVFGAEGGVVVSTEKATNVMLYTIAGQLVSKSTVAAGTSTVSVAPGFYVVRAAGTAAKVVVK